MGSETSAQPIETALDVALVVMRSGGATRMADRTFLNVLASRDSGARAAWRLDLAAAHSNDHGGVSVVRPVGPMQINLTRASEAAMLSERVFRGEVDSAALPSELARVNAIGAPYSAAVRVLAAAVAAATFARMSGGDWGSAATVFIAAGLGQILRRYFNSLNLPAAPTTLLCGLLSAWLAALALRFGIADMAAATLIGSVIYLVPGLPLINGFFDVVAERYVAVGAQRILEAAILFVLLAIAIASAAVLILEYPRVDGEPLPVLFTSLWAGVSATCIAILLTAPRGHLVGSFLCGATGRLVRDQLMATGWPIHWATLVASVAVVLVAVALLRRHSVSPVVLIGGVVPLTSTSAMFDAIIGLMRVATLQGEALARTSDVITAATGTVFVTSIAIAVGLGAGMSIVRLVRSERAWLSV